MLKIILTKIREKGVCQVLTILMLSYFLLINQHYFQSNVLVHANTLTAIGSTCKTQVGTQLAVDNSAHENLVLFNNSSTLCEYEPTKVVSLINQSLVPAMQKDPTYDASTLHGVLYYPTTKGMTPAHVVLVAATGGVNSKAIYAVYWQFDTATNYPKVDLTSIRVTKVFTNTSNLNMMHLDDLNNGTPLNLWFTDSLAGKIYKVPWSNISALVDPWITSIQNNAYAPIPAISQIDPASANCNSGINCEFYNGQEINNVTFVNNKGNGLIYAGDVENGTPIAQCTIPNHAIIIQFDAKSGAILNCFDTNFNVTVGYTLPNFSIKGYSESQLFSKDNLSSLQRSCITNCKWDLDGAESYINGINHYLIVSAHNSNILWVIKDVDQSAKTKILGMAVIGKIDSPALKCTPGYPALNACGIEGVEIDSAGQVYLNAENEGIFTTAADDLITSATANGTLTYSGSIINSSPVLYVNTNDYFPNNAKINGVNYTGSWHFSAPLSGIGSPASQTSLIYNKTEFGSTFSQGGYSISNLSNNYYSDNLVIAGKLPDGSPSPMSFTNGSAGKWQWSFRAYTSSLNHLINQMAGTSNYGFTTLHNNVCRNNSFCTTLIASQMNNGTSDTIDNNNKVMANNGVYYYTPSTGTSGTLTINEDSGGGGMDTSENGMLFVNGNVSIIADHQCNINSGKLMIIASGNITIDPSTNSIFGQTTNQCLKTFLISDQTISVNNYKSTPPAYQPLVITGSLISYMGIVQNLDVGPLNTSNPATDIQYDSSYITNYQYAFMLPYNNSEIGR